MRTVPNPEGLPAIVGRRIRELRKQRRMSLEELAQAVGRGKAAVSRYERAEMAMTLEILASLASALKTTPGALVAGAEPECECFGESGIYASTHVRDGRLRCDLCGRPVRTGAVDAMTVINRGGVIG